MQFIINDVQDRNRDGAPRYLSLSGDLCNYDIQVTAYPSATDLIQAKIDNRLIINMTGQKHGSEYAWFPMIEAPWMTFENAMTAAATILSKPGNYIVHCHAGSNRSPLVLGIIEAFCLNKKTEALINYSNSKRPWKIKKSAWRSIKLWRMTSDNSNTLTNIEKALYAYYFSPKKIPL